MKMNTPVTNEEEEVFNISKRNISNKRKHTYRHTAKQRLDDKAAVGHPIRRLETEDVLARISVHHNTNPLTIYILGYSH